MECSKPTKSCGKTALRKEDEAKENRMAVIPYVRGVSEAVARVYRGYGVSNGSNETVPDDPKPRDASEGQIRQKRNVRMFVQDPMHVV